MAGSPEALRDGLVLLAWEGPEGRWLHDHGIGGGHIPAVPGRIRLEVVEHFAMLPTAPVSLYRLQASYHNRVTGEAEPLEVLPVTIDLRADVPAKPVPKLDLLTLFRQFTTALPQGPAAFEATFEGVARVSMYDPDQDYFCQVELAARLRQSDGTEALPKAYEQLLALALQRDARGAIPVAERLLALHPGNAIAHSYLALFHLYLFSPGQAEAPLTRVRALAPDSVEIRTLAGGAALMQGRLGTVWRSYQDLRARGVF